MWRRNVLEVIGQCGELRLIADTSQDLKSVAARGYSFNTVTKRSAEVGVQSSFAFVPWDNADDPDVTHLEGFVVPKVQESTDGELAEGGPSSGNYGHSGRPGQIGGSGPGGEGTEFARQAAIEQKLKVVIQSPQPWESDPEGYAKTAMLRTEVARLVNSTVVDTGQGEITLSPDGEVVLANALALHPDEVLKHVKSFTFIPDPVWDDFCRQNNFPVDANGKNIVGAVTNGNNEIAAPVGMIASPIGHFVIGHEVGHIAWRNSPAKAEWSTRYSGNPGFDRLTAYSQVSKEEAFCETYGAYVMYNHLDGLDPQVEEAFNIVDAVVGAEK
jgi:hypothetical protein